MRLGIATDRVPLTEQTVYLDAADSFSNTLPLQWVVKLPAGRHTVILTARGYTTAEAEARDSELVAIVLPSA